MLKSRCTDLELFGVKPTAPSTPEAAGPAHRHYDVTAVGEGEDGKLNSKTL